MKWLGMRTSNVDDLWTLLAFLQFERPEMSATQKHKSRAMRGFRVWWAHTDLNRGPKDYESSALTN
ncbi:hypothetical protein EMIT0P12_110120 [Pseudomonas sp. IT-P12]